MMISTLTHYCLLANTIFFSFWTIVLHMSLTATWRFWELTLCSVYGGQPLWELPSHIGQSKNGTHQFCQTENYFRPNWPNPGRMTNLLIGSTLSWRNKCIIFVDWPIRAGWPVLTICKHPYSSISPSSLSMHLCELPSPSSSTNLCLLFQVWYQ